MTIIIVRAFLTVIVFGGVVYNVNTAGLIEVFQWKQMDFYNRGSIATPTPGGVVKPSKNQGNIVFPDRYSHQNSRWSRSPEVHTSRDDPVETEQRFGKVDRKDAADNSSSYIAYNNVPMGATHHKGRLFVTMPRRRVGIPSTLNYVDMRKDGSQRSPKLYAYPDFETNILGQNFTSIPNHIVSVYRTTVDACERLWFIDTGMLEYPNNRVQVQRPAIWVMNLGTDRVVRRFEIPQSIVDTGRGLASITVDTQAASCAKAYAYIPDLVNNQLYVFSFEADRMWSFSHNYFNFDPVAGDLNIAGQTFRWDDGIFSATLGPRGTDGHREVYFHAMASNNEFVVSSSVLQNETNAARSDHGQDFRLMGLRGERRQSTMHAYDPRTAVIFYAEIQRSGIGCWNTAKPFTAANHGTVAADPDRMIYPSDLTVRAYSVGPSNSMNLYDNRLRFQIDDDGIIWVMTNSMPIFIYSTLDVNILNFRVWKQDVFTAARDTVCQ